MFDMLGLVRKTTKVRRNLLPYLRHGFPDKQVDPRAPPVQALRRPASRKPTTGTPSCSMSVSDSNQSGQVFTTYSLWLLFELLLVFVYLR